MEILISLKDLEAVIKIIHDFIMFYRNNYLKSLGFMHNVFKRYH